MEHIGSLLARILSNAGLPCPAAKPAGGDGRPEGLQRPVAGTGAAERDQTAARPDLVLNPSL